MTQPRQSTSGKNTDNSWNRTYGVFSKFLETGHAWDHGNELLASTTLIWICIFLWWACLIGQCSVTKQHKRTSETAPKIIGQMPAPKMKIVQTGFGPNCVWMPPCIEQTSRKASQKALWSRSQQIGRTSALETDTWHHRDRVSNVWASVQRCQHNTDWKLSTGGHKCMWAVTWKWPCEQMTCSKWLQKVIFEQLLGPTTNWETQQDSHWPNDRGQMIPW